MKENEIKLITISTSLHNAISFHGVITAIYVHGFSLYRKFCIFVAHSLDYNGIGERSQPTHIDARLFVPSAGHA